MNKEFVTCEIAIALKELGFNEPCFTTYDHEGRLRNPFDYAKSEYDGDALYIEDTKEWIYNSGLTIKNFNAPTHLFTQFIAAPLYQQAFRWFREKYGIVGIVKFGTQEFTYNIYNNDAIGLLTKDSLDFNATYEEAEIACLKKLIEIVKS